MAKPKVPLKKKKKVWAKETKKPMTNFKSE